MSKNTGLYFVGDLVIDQVPDPEKANAVQWMAGGSMYFGSLGAAVALKDRGLDQDVGSFYVGPLGNDHFGQAAKENFAASGVGTEYAHQTDFVNIFASVSEDGKGGNKYSFYTRSNAGPLDLPSSFREDNRIFVMGDIVSAMEPNAAILLGFAQQQAGNHDIIVFDPNTRPPVVGNLKNYRTDIESWVQTVSVVKASEEDIEFIYPHLTQEQVVQRWQDLGLSAVFVTHGSKGCSVHSGGQTATVAASRHPDIRRTIGAGDNFNAGIAVSLAQKGLTKSFSLADLNIGDWKAVAADAAGTSFRHLLRTNNLDVK